jgi:AAA15 family ATPase/GTPase
MLLEFKMKNVFSYKDEVVFTLLAPSNKVKNRYSDNYVTICGYDILKTAVVVGENAGGKSNFIKGIQYFKSFFNETSKAIKSDRLSVFFGKNDEQSFSITTTNGKVVFSYNLSICRFGITKEMLTYTTDKKKKEHIVFSYEADYHIVSQDEEKSTVTVDMKLDIQDNHSLEKSLFENIKNNSNKGLILSYLSILGISQTTEFIETIIEIDIQKNPLDLQLSLNYSIGQKLTEYDFEIMEKPEFLDIFKLVDSSIKNIEIDKESPFTKTIVIRNTEDGKEKKNPIFIDSTGVKNFIVFSLIIYKVIYQGITSFNDEMDSTFNPILTSKVISYINSCETTGQFIFTTHNIFNMNLQMFLKEQMYIVGKDKTTLESNIYSLSEFSDIRYDSNDKIYEYYMKGLLGGVDND